MDPTSKVQKKREKFMLDEQNVLCGGLEVYPEGSNSFKGV